LRFQSKRFAVRIDTGAYTKGEDNMKSITCLFVILGSVLYSGWSVASILVHNCTTDSIDVAIFNDDSVTLVFPYEKRVAQAGRETIIICSTSDCVISARPSDRSQSGSEKPNKKKFTKNKGVKVYLWGTGKIEFSTESPKMTRNKSEASSTLCYLR